MAILTAEVAVRYEDVSYAEIKDPFDRIIVATAWAAAILLVTADGTINRLGGQSESSAIAAKARGPTALADGWSDGVRAGEWPANWDQGAQVIKVAARRSREAVPRCRGRRRATLPATGGRCSGPARCR